MLRIPSYDEFQALNESLPPQYILDKWRREGFVPPPEPFHALGLSADGGDATPLREALSREGVEFTEGVNPKMPERTWFTCEKLGDYSPEGAALVKRLKEAGVRFHECLRMY